MFTDDSYACPSNMSKYLSLYQGTIQFQLTLFLCFVLLASPAGSLQDVSPPSTPSSRASMFESSSHSSSPQLVSLSPHGYQTSQSPLQLNLRHGVSQTNVITQQYAKQQYSTQPNLPQYGLVNNGNSHNVASSLLNNQSQKSYDLEMNKRPALHPLQQATLLQQRKLTEVRLVIHLFASKNEH